MTITKRDLVEMWIHKTLDKLSDSDNGMRYMVRGLLELIEIEREKNKAQTLAAAIMSLAFDHSPTKEKYVGHGSKSWEIMWKMNHEAIYDQIRKVNRRLYKAYGPHIDRLKEEYDRHA